MAHLILIDQGPPSLVYLGCKTISDITHSTVTFTGCPFGTPRADRIIIIGIGTFSDNIASVTIAGIAPALASGSRSQSNSPFPYCGGIYSLALPTGTSGDIVLTASGTTGTANNPAVQIYAAYGLRSATSVDGDNGVGGVGSDNGSVSVPSAGIVVALGMETSNSTPPATISWTGVNKDNQTNYTSSIVSSASFGPASSAQTLNVSVSIGAGFVAPNLSVASFR